MFTLSSAPFSSAGLCISDSLAVVAGVHNTVSFPEAVEGVSAHLFACDFGLLMSIVDSGAFAHCSGATGAAKVADAPIAEKSTEPAGTVLAAAVAAATAA